MTRMATVGYCRNADTKRTEAVATGARERPENAVSTKRATIERLAAFSDGIFSVIITIMVLDLKPPEHPTFAALWPLWPTALSYAVSYAFIAIVWLNHHHFAHLFMVSLVPFTTAWVADTHLASVPVFAYAAVFLLVELAYLQFEHYAITQAAIEELPRRTRRLARVRSVIALGLFLSAMLVALRFPPWGFGLVCCAVLLYLKPELSRTAEDGQCIAE
jgi:uncharacterized membrane protein